MVVTCLAPRCKNQKNLHVFPVDSLRRKQWIAFVKAEDEDFNVEIHYRPSICNDHFDEASIANFIEVQAGLSRLYMLTPDAIPSKHTAAATGPQVTAGKRLLPVNTAKASGENNSKTLKFSKCSLCLKNVFGSLNAHNMRVHSGVAQRVVRKPSVKVPEPPEEYFSKFRLKQRRLMEQNITESSQLGNVPSDVNIRLAITGQKDSIMTVINSGDSSFPKVTSLLCNIFKVLLSEQNFGVIAGRLSEPTDRLVRVTNINEEYIRFLRKSATFRLSKSSTLWPEFFTDDQLVKAIVLRMTHIFNDEAERSRLIEPVWKPTLRLQKYTGLMQESARVIKSTVSILG